MSTLRTEHIFTSTLEDTFHGICQYEKYPEYLPGVTKVEVTPAKKPGTACQVRYELNLIKKFYYILDMVEAAPHKIAWSLAESNLMKTNNGSWELKAKGKETLAIYSLDLEFKGLVPNAVVSKISKANLPAMLAGFQQLIDDRET